MNIFTIFGTLQTAEIADVNVTIGTAMTQAISSNPLLLGLAILLMIFFTMMMLQDLFKKVFIVFISIMLLYMLASGDISTLTKIVVVGLLMVTFVVKFGTYVIMGTKEKRNGKPLWNNIFYHLVDLRITNMFVDILNAARYAWQTTFRTTVEGVKYLTYWKWK